jgi:SAM-dependent methyltransferase
MSIKIRNWLPASISAMLWGDRKRWGLSVNEEDSCWKEWQKTYINFYEANQRKGIGICVNDAGYQVMKSIDLTGKRVLEIGAGDIRHLRYMQGKPQEYVLADISTEMMQFAQAKLGEKKIPFKSILLDRNQPLPLQSASVDVIISFYSLEHLYPLKPYLEEMHRVLKPGGTLIGAIPAEGGLAWGVGRMLTSRQWLKKNTTINYNKIISWEHPNFADKIIHNLDEMFLQERVQYWPFPWFPFLDLNLILRFVYQKHS